MSRCPCEIRPVLRQQTPSCNTPTIKYICTGSGQVSVYTVAIGNCSPSLTCFPVGVPIKVTMVGAGNGGQTVVMTIPSNILLNGSSLRLTVSCTNGSSVLEILNPQGVTFPPYVATGGTGSASGFILLSI